MYSKSHQIEFEKYAKIYDLNATVQKKVAKELVKKLDFRPKTILDLGCGTGEVYKNISWEVEKYIGIDSSKSMCELHPKSDKIEIFCDDFESKNFIEKISKYKFFDLVISSSSLQWASDIEKVFKIYSKLSNKIAFSIFTNKTFKTIYEITNTESFLPSFDFIYLLSKTLNNCTIERKIYKMDFADNLSMLRYIKHSGISGGNKVLDYKKIKHLLNNYPLSYLEFEVAIVVK